MSAIHHHGSRVNLLSFEINTYFITKYLSNHQCIHLFCYLSKDSSIPLFLSGNLLLSLHILVLKIVLYFASGSYFRQAIVVFRHFPVILFLTQEDVLCSSCIFFFCPIPGISPFSQECCFVLFCFFLVDNFI